MGRIKLLIGDEDKSYVESITAYLMEKFPYRFQVNYFTNVESFKKFLAVNDRKTDIILVGRGFTNIIDMSDKQQNFEATPVVIQIAEKEVSSRGNNVYKYSNGYDFAKNIISIYEKSMHVNTFQKQQQTTRIMAVYSPAGGTGKTTIAANLSKCFSKEGFKTFYLNMESINSQSCFFGTNFRKNNDDSSYGISPETQGCFSKALFALKQEDEKLSLLVKEAIKYVGVGNIGYFPPPDSFSEMDELDFSDIKLLLEEIKQSGSFNIILLDLSSSFSFKYLALMEECHEIIVLTTPDRISVSKLISFLNDICLHQKKRGINFLDKMILVMNRWQENTINNQNLKELNHILSSMGKSLEITLHDDKTGILQDFDIENDFGSFDRELHKIVSRYLNNCGEFQGFSNCAEFQRYSNVV